MSIRPAVTTCDVCGIEYRLGKETEVYLCTAEPSNSYYSTVCPHCEVHTIVMGFDPEVMRRSILACNNFGPRNRVILIDEREFDLWKEELE